MNDAKERSIKKWDRLPACHAKNDRMESYPTGKTSRSISLAMNSTAIAKTYFEHGQFVRFMQLPLDFRLITTDTSANTLAAPLSYWATSPLDNVHQGRVIFLRSSDRERLL